MAEKGTDRFLRRQEWMEGWADGIQRLVGAVYRGLGPLGRPLRNLLTGESLFRHPLHPALTDVPLGAWLAGTALDYLAVASNLVPRGAGSVALAVGLLGAGGAAITGYTDFADTYGLERRGALAHGLTMTVVVLLMTASLVLRIFGLYSVGIALSTIGLVVTFFGMYLGGHVVYGYGTRINRLAFLEGPEEYALLGSTADFPEGQMRKLSVNGFDVLAVRLGGTLHAIANTCSHAGGPLNEGTLEGDTVTCPWHGSQFSVRDGVVRGGPAAFPQVRMEVREVDGRVEAKLAEPLH